MFCFFNLFSWEILSYIWCDVDKVFLKNWLNGENLDNDI